MRSYDSHGRTLIETKIATTDTRHNICSDSKAFRGTCRLSPPPPQQITLTLTTLRSITAFILLTVRWLVLGKRVICFGGYNRQVVLFSLIKYVHFIGKMSFVCSSLETLSIQILRILGNIGNWLDWLLVADCCRLSTCVMIIDNMLLIFRLYQKGQVTCIVHCWWDWNLLSTSSRTCGVINWKIIKLKTEI